MSNEKQQLTQYKSNRAELDVSAFRELEFIKLVEHLPVDIYLVNGVKISCSIIYNDDVCLIVTQHSKTNPSKGDKKMLIYKASIASISPQ